MKKYGLQLRVQPQQKKQPTKPPLPSAPGFNDEDDDDVEREILRQAHKSKTHKDVEEQHKKALEEDPSVFDYDGVYDEMKEKQVRPKQQDREEKKPRYIQALIDKAKQREREHEIVYERKLAKERTKEEHLYVDKDKYVTSAYKKKLAEQAKWMEEERLRELREEKEDVTKKTDISDFYFNLAKNVAFGAGESSSKKPEMKIENVVNQLPEAVASQATDDANLESSKPVNRHKEEPLKNVSPKDKSDADNAYPESIDETEAPLLEKGEDNKPLSGDEQPKTDHHKRSEDSVAAAKERFLARKKAKKVQSIV